jgi:glucose-1-phosphate cytidylyltransferase
MTAVQPEGRYGALDINENNQKISKFLEKPLGDNAWVNGGFFVCEPEIFDFIKEDFTIFEKEPLEHLAKEGRLYAYKHYGFWKCMDTLRDKVYLNDLWNTKKAPWKVWDK